MRRFLLVLLAVVIVFSFTISLSAADKVTLRLGWWGNPTRDARTIKVVEMYEALNPNVNIETETVGWAGYWDKLNTQGAAGNLPDIIQMDYAYITTWVKNDQLLDLGPYVKSKKLDLTGVPETFISGGRVKNKLYGVSLGTNAVCMIYDPAILQKAGVAAPTPDWTWADLEKMALEIYNKTGVQVPPLGGATDPRVVFDNMIRQTKKAFFNPKDGASLGFTDTKLLIEWFETNLRLLKAGAMVRPDIAFGGAVTPQESGLAKGTEWLGPAFWSNQVVMMQTAMNRPIGIITMPKIAKSKQPGTYLKPSMFFSVTKKSLHKDEAVKFVNYFINDIEANKVLMGERGIPIVPKVRDTLKALVDPVNKQIFDYIDLAGNNASPIDPPDPPGAGEVLKAFLTINQEVLYQTISPKEAAAKFMKQANEILAKNKAAN
ncbi:MAG: extracellular solute-binding protein [Firmicutes bacterium]|nr:extracellular solute-binding protein [Bacillota bacterium]